MSLCSTSTFSIPQSSRLCSQVLLCKYDVGVASYSAVIAVQYSLRKQPTFRDATTGFPAKWRLRNDCRNSILMTRHYPDLVIASDWLEQIFHAARPIRSTTRQVISMEFLQSFLDVISRSRKTRVVSRKVSCFHLAMSSTALIALVWFRYLY